MGKSTIFFGQPIFSQMIGLLIFFETDYPRDPSDSQPDRAILAGHGRAGHRSISCLTQNCEKAVPTLPAVGKLSKGRQGIYRLNEYFFM